MTTGPGTPAPLDLANEMAKGTLMERMGIVFVEVGPDRLVATMPVEGNTQPYGLLHGGASVVLAETLGSFGSVLHAGRTGSRSASRSTPRTTGRPGPALVTGIGDAAAPGLDDGVLAGAGHRRAGPPVCTARITCLLRDAAPGASAGP